VRVFSWGQGDEGVRGEWSEVFGWVWGWLWRGGCGRVEGRQGQRGLWVVGGIYERGVPLGGGGVGFSRWDAEGGRECRRA